MESLTSVVGAAQEGSEEAFSCLFRALNPQILRYLRHHAGAAAEDLAAETWLAVANGFDRFAGDDGDFRSWLFSIARRRVVDHFRREHRRPRTVALGAVDALAPGGDFQADVVGAMSAERAVEILVRDLPADQAEVVVLRVVGGLDVDEVARILGRTPGWVRVAQHRALRRMRERHDHRELRLAVTA